MDTIITRFILIAYFLILSGLVCFGYYAYWATGRYIQHRRVLSLLPWYSRFFIGMHCIVSYLGLATYIYLLLSLLSVTI